MVKKVSLLFVLLAGVWLVLPPSLGGPTSYIVVDGQSMEPLLFTGDLAVISRLPRHDAGDLVVFDIGSDGWVIHRLVERSANGEWITRGDNKTANDPWTIPDSAIVGTYVMSVPGAGESIAWFKARPLSVAFLAGLLAMAMYLPFGRLLPRRWRKPAEALDSAQEADATERTVITLALSGAAASVGLLVLMVVKQANALPLPFVVGTLGPALVAGSSGSVLLVGRVKSKRSRSSKDGHAREGELDEHEAVPTR